MSQKHLYFRQPPEFPQLETEVLDFWQKTQAFAKSVEQRPADKAYVFYDGPPFATGMPHYGHLLASTIKDVIPRYWTMKGYRVNHVWGWDCHGLPIENMIEKQLDIKGGKKGIEALGIDKFNQACRSEVMRLDKEWEKIIGRLGRWVDFEHNYKTMDRTFMESVWWGFSELYKKGLIYEGKRVILYCPRCSTPLSNFEIAMDNSYQEVTEPSNVYKYKVTGEENTYLLAWSTTPWSKLATPALAVNPTLTYVKVKQGSEHYILAESTLATLKNEPYKVMEKMTGKALEQYTFELHFDFYPQRAAEEKAGVVIADDFVTAEEGTGIVTLAVYGEDDFRIMQQHGVQLIEHVDEEGKLKPEIKPWGGPPILEADASINEDLDKRGLIYREFPHTHSVATCYRCGTRLYYAPMPAWFIDIKSLRQDLIAQNESINWYPQHLKHGRFGKGLENAPDWNISRSRYWGTPMPIWRSGPTGSGESQPLTRVIGSLEELKTWAVDPQAVAAITDIHREFLDDVEVWVDEAKTIKGRRVSEVFDCWIESGSMPFASLHYPFANREFFEQNYPAQFVSEYIAQTRAWFYTMHVMSVGIFGKPPFENVLTTGNIMAEDGSKMSKSKKNYPDPMILINTYGVDSLRLYLMSSTVMKGENLNFSEKDVADIRRKVFVVWWNVLSFYQQYTQIDNLPKTLAKNPQHILDQWMVSRLTSFMNQVTAAYDNYDVVKASRLLIEFVTELSTWYLRLSRDRLKQEPSGETAQILGYVIYTLAQLAAPIAPFFAELVHQTLVDEATSIHHTDWPIADPTLQNQELETEMEVVKTVVELGHAQRKLQQVKVRQPLQKITVDSTQSLKYESDLSRLVMQELNVKTVIWWSSDVHQTTLTVNFDFTLTEELKAEGQARELVRSIQDLRKKHGVDFAASATVKVPDWPTAWQQFIEEKTHSKLIKGETLELEQSA